MKTVNIIVGTLTTTLILSGCANNPKPGSPESAALIQQKKKKKYKEVNQKLMHYLTGQRNLGCLMLLFTV